MLLFTRPRPHRVIEQRQISTAVKLLGQIGVELRHLLHRTGTRLGSGRCCAVLHFEGRQKQLEGARPESAECALVLTTRWELVYSLLLGGLGEAVFTLRAQPQPHYRREQP